MNDRASWGRIGRVAGIVAGVAFVVQTLLFLADALDLFGASPDFHKTSAGPAHDIATFYADYLNHLHAIWWDIAVRDALGPLGYVALMVLALAFFSLIRVDRPERSLLVLFFTVGGVFAAISDLTYLATLQYARYGGWQARPFPNMIAVGRAIEAINDLTDYTQLAGFLVLAIGLVCLGRLATPAASSLLRVAAYAEAVALVGIALARAVNSDTGYNIMALLTGVVLAPLVGFVGARDVGRLAATAPVPDQPLSSSASRS